MTESTKKIDLNRYSEFVESLTSKASGDLTTFMDRLDYIDANYEGDGKYGPDVQVPLLIVSAMGLCGEAGEFSEIVKKVMFHGKDVTAEVHQHMCKELGDIIWYWTNACRALDVDPNQIIADNIVKLENRHPDGKFDAWYMENRYPNDV